MTNTAYSALNWQMLQKESQGKKKQGKNKDHSKVSQASANKNKEEENERTQQNQRRRRNARTQNITKGLEKTQRTQLNQKEENDEEHSLCSSQLAKLHSKAKERIKSRDPQRLLQNFSSIS